MHVVRTEYEVDNGRPVVHVFCRENGKRVVVKDSSLVPYLYVPYSERGNVIGVDCDPGEYVSVYGDRLAKLYTTLPSDVPKLREHYSSHYEADVVFPIRYLIDKVAQIEPCEPKAMFVDIETDSQGRIPDPNSAPEPIIAITGYTGYCYTTFIHRSDLSTGVESRISWDCLHEIRYHRTEKEMLQDFLWYCEHEEPDVLSGWNFTRFDLPYIINRMKRLGIDYTKLSPMGSVYEYEKNSEFTIKGVAIVDLLAAYKHHTQPTQGMKASYSLDAIGKEVLGQGKVGSSENVKWMWKFGLNELIDYNTADVHLCVAIDEKEQILDFLNGLRALCYCQLEDGLTATKMIDCYILKMFHGKIVFPSKEYHESTKYQGAIVETAGGGLYENVAVYDLKSLYPSIILMANLSPESMSDEAEEDTVQVGNFYVRQGIDGYLPKVVKTLMLERTRYKDLMVREQYGTDRYKFFNMRQYAMKILLNAIYGQTAYPNSRIYDYRVAETITWLGRKVITWSRDYLEELGLNTVYLDTDSCHVVFDTLNIESIKSILDLVNQSYVEFVAKMGFKHQSLQMELDKVYRKVFYGLDTKKRYAGALCYKDDREVDALDIWGFESKRSDASKFTKSLQTMVFDMVLRQGKPKEAVVEYLIGEIERIRKGNFTFDEIGIPKGITRDPRSYCRYGYDPKLPSWGQKGLSANIRGTLYSIDNLKSQLSNKPKMVYVRRMPDGYKPVDVICFDEEWQVPPGTQIDIEKMLEKTMRAKLEPIFTGLGWRMSELSHWWKGKSSPQGKQERLL